MELKSDLKRRKNAMNVFYNSHYSHLPSVDQVGGPFSVSERMWSKVHVGNCLFLNHID